MKITILIPAILLQSFAVIAAPHSRAQFCELRKNPSYFIEQARDVTNHLAFSNYGGLFNGGVCWWHSLFQRASLYLVVFRPELSKPALTQAKLLIHSIAAGKRVIEIPGYSNMLDFSRDYESLIQSKLEEWQKIDGFLKFAWIQGLSGSTSTSPDIIKRNITQFHTLLTTQYEIPWVMLQLKGIASHSILPVGINTTSIGVTIPHLDSNYIGRVLQFSYVFGERSLYTSGYGHFVPYLGRHSDFSYFYRAANEYCSSEPKVVPPSEEVLSNHFD
ncbi:MAG: hypothetical protein AB7F59_11830 [Bdellovibrionales bacterium]